MVRWSKEEGGGRKGPILSTCSRPSMRKEGACIALQRSTCGTFPLTVHNRCLLLSTTTNANISNGNADEAKTDYCRCILLFPIRWTFIPNSLCLTLAIPIKLLHVHMLGYPTQCLRLFTNPPRICSRIFNTPTNLLHRTIIFPQFLFRKTCR